MAPLLATAVATYKQKRFDAAALEAMKAHDARIQIVPVEAKLNANDMAILANNPRQFDASSPLLSCSELFSHWHGLPQSWIDECFGEDLGKRLVKIKLIKLESRPVEQPPVAKHSDLDLQIAEAAGFHRAINIWNDSHSWTPLYIQQQLRDQATELGKILSDYNIDEPSTLPGKFKHDSAAYCPYQLRLSDRQAANALLASSYFDVYMGMRD
ncbi:uncharacterized protein J4E84_011088 [Alternaria hordeiaustralica]|uniref:uncharacterized protein n=1 Tax=Alternaria hordeiaustralica TaxID=1187925 RepID=UPI0020C3995E|nr:uncharacterized protein J4E84_011088 [Alternaria hordeiaustralica]KAI4673409.1 hypothetical protein J4E84_011088 [Alternaria hordeiaustralica]